MRYLLYAVPLSPVYSLDQALDWVAHRSYSSAYPYEEEPLDEIFEEFFEDIWDSPFIEGKLEQLYPDIPQEPEYPEWKPEIPRNEYTSAFTLYQQQYEEYEKAWDDALYDYCSHARAQLFLALKEGRLKAYGRRYGQMKPDIPVYRWNDDEAWEEPEEPEPPVYLSALKPLLEEKEAEHSGFAAIPAAFWDSEGIYWFNAEARSRHGRFRYIFIETTALFQVFAEPEGKPVTVTERNGELMMDAEHENQLPAHTESARGRKSYPWAEVHAEIMRFCLEGGGLPEKQMVLESHIQAWCEKHWSIVPSHGAIHGILKPYYMRVRNSEEGISDKFA